MRAAGITACLAAWTASAAEVLSARIGADPVNCTEMPFACQPPFSCDNQPTKKGKQCATDGGHADFTFWCGTPQYLPAVDECYKGNLTGYGALMTAAQAQSAGVPDIDATYCFEIGHCGYAEDPTAKAPTGVTDTTTLAEMEALCDARWGHKKWATITAASALAQLAIAMAPVAGGGELGKGGAKAMSVLSCASGNYHGDAIYCRDAYCSNPDYQKHAHLRPNKT
eukprot:gene4137-1024_t